MTSTDQRDTVLAAWPKWRDDLIVQLRLNDVSGDQIGDILLEAEGHVRETGETPEAAFGPARAYAESRSAAISNPPGDEDDDANLISQIVIPGLGGFLLATGAFGIGAGDETWGSSRAWLMFIIGAGLLTWVHIHLPVDLITDPRSGKPLFQERREMTLILLSTLLLVAAILYGAGRILA